MNDLFQEANKIVSDAVFKKQKEVATLNHEAQNDKIFQERIDSFVKRIAKKEDEIDLLIGQLERYEEQMDKFVQRWAKERVHKGL